jgi:hypothetical protein
MGLDETLEQPISEDLELGRAVHRFADSEQGNAAIHRRHHLIDGGAE